jgi:hypothetical protein
MKLTGIFAAAPALTLGLLLCGCQPKGDKAAQSTTGVKPAGGEQAKAPDATGAAQSGGAQKPLTPSGFAGTAKDFKYRDPNGGLHQLSEFAGQPIVVDFWAVW